MKKYTKLLTSVLVFANLFLVNNVSKAQIFSASNKDYKNQKPKVVETSQSLKSVLKAIENSFSVSIMADNDLLEGKSAIFNKLNTVEETLSAVTTQHSLTFEKIGKKQYVIFIKKIELKTINSINDIRIFNILKYSLPVPKQEDIYKTTMVEIKGRVTSENNEPLPGANIKVKNSTNNGTTTDNNGYFKITMPKAEGTLIVSFIGYITQNVTINGTSDLKISLSSDLQNLDEVVVIGYGNQKRSSITGAVSSVKAEDLKNLPAQNLGTLLQGRVPGLFVSTESGNPNSGAKIVIRGPVSINGGDPLVVVDGVPFQGVGFDFNAQDIENVEVLKDAAAAAIYGAQGSAGVILVTTKRGKSGETKISFSTILGIREALALPKTLRRDDFLRAKEAFGFDVIDLFGPKIGWSSLPDVDWFDETFNQGSEQSYNLSLAGGGEKSTFFISGNYSKIKGIKIQSEIEKYNLRINTDHKISKRFSFGQTLFVKATDEDPSGGSLSFRHIPIMNVYDPTNPIGGWGKTPRGFIGGNEVQAELGNITYVKNWQTTLTGYLDFYILDNLKFRTLLGATINSSEYSAYTAKADLGSSVAAERFDKNLSRSLGLITTFTLNYDKAFGRHQFKALAGYEARKEDYTSINYGNIDPLVPNPQNSSLVKNTATATASFQQGNIGNRILSQFGRLEYEYGGKYFLTANIRRDGIATKFGPANRFGIFPGISGGWKISDESFMKELTFVSTMKLRASYGSLGNSNIPDFLFASAIEQGFSADVGTSGIRQSSLGIASRLANSDIQWEEVATTNFGLDASFIKNKLIFNLDYYSRQTTKMLYGLAIAPSAGLGSEVKANIGQMSNKGIELNIEWRDKLRDDFSYSIGINGAFNTNKLISLNPDLGRLFITSGNSGVELYDNRLISKSESGKPLGQFFGYQVLGIYQNDISGSEKRPVISSKDDYVPRAGDLIYQDLNGDFKIDDNDKTYIGNPWPKFNYGINLMMAYKNFDLRAFFNGVAGNDIYNAYESNEHTFFSTNTTTNKIFETSGFAGNGVTSKPRVGKINDLDNNGNWSSVSSYHVQDGSYLRLKNIQLGYSLPNSLSKKMNIRNARIFVMADNLLTFTKYKGLNPELGLNDFLSLGIDNAVVRYPMSKLLSVGLNLEF